MTTAKAPTGTPFAIPATAHEDFQYFKPSESEDIRRYYEEYGYVVIRGLIPQEICRQAREAFAREVKPYQGFIYRQTTASPERHALTPHGYMLNPILNVQSMARSFTAFRPAALSVITHLNLQTAVRSLFGEPGKLVQSMYFEGNPATPPHQDTYYLDASQIGRMVAAWIAVEDIAPGAGRFYIYPGSHRLPAETDMDAVLNPERSYARILKLIADNHFECRAPALNAGDVLLWSAKTIHGSLDTTQPERSRSSFTSHFIPQSCDFVQWHTRVKPLDIERINGLDVHRPKDLARVSNRAIFWAEAHFPRTFRATKRTVTRLVSR